MLSDAKATEDRLYPELQVAEDSLLSAKDVRAKLQNMRQKNEEAYAHQQSAEEIALRQTYLIKLVETINQMASDDEQERGRIYWAVEELHQFVAFLRPYTLRSPKKRDRVRGCCPD